ncbi:MAG: hypothetical protein Q7T82_03620 [Armatimonadota bacterium]|nr:hypothetical protein [Armatimonadota bacterium]
MNCEETRNSLDEYLLREKLCDDVVAGIQAHVTACAECRRNVEYRKLSLARESAPIIRKSHDLLLHAIARGARSLRLELGAGDGTAVLSLPDGREETIETMPKHIAELTLTRFRVMAEPLTTSDLAHRDIRIQHQDWIFSVRAAFERTPEGEKATFEFPRRCAA